MGKPTSRDKEEMLIPYDNMIAIDTRKIISHEYQVCLFPCSNSRNAMLDDIEPDENRSKEQLPSFRRPLLLNRHPFS